MATLRLPLVISVVALASALTACGAAGADQAPTASPDAGESQAAALAPLRLANGLVRVPLREAQTPDALLDLAVDVSMDGWDRSEVVQLDMDYDRTGKARRIEAVLEVFESESEEPTSLAIVLVVDGEAAYVSAMELASETPTTPATPATIAVN